MPTVPKCSPSQRSVRLGLNMVWLHYLAKDCTKAETESFCSGAALASILRLTASIFAATSASLRVCVAELSATSALLCPLAAA